MNSTPAPTMTLNLVGATLTALQRATIGASSGLILSLLPARDEQSMDLPLPLHICFLAAMTVNLPPGVEATPESLKRAGRCARPELMLRTHTGPLPKLITEVAEDIEPAIFGVLMRQTVTATIPPPDGAQGIVLVFGDPPTYGIQIDLIGVHLLKYEEPKATEEN